MRYGLVLFGMLLAAATVVTVEAAQFFVGLEEGEDGTFPFALFKTDVTTMTVIEEEEDFGVVLVEGSEEDAEELDNLPYVLYVQIDDMNVESEDNSQGMGMEQMDSEDMGGMMKGEMMDSEDMDMMGEELDSEDMGM